MTDATPRSLTKGEQFVLVQIQDIYGPQNEESACFSLTRMRRPYS